MNATEKKKNFDIIMKQIEAVKTLKVVAEKVTLTEFLELYSDKYDYLSLASLWFSFNNDPDIDIIHAGIGGTDPY